jgi:hypothetical protein
MALYLTKHQYLYLCRLSSGDILDKNVGKFSKGTNEEDLAISIPSDRILEDGNIRQVWMMVY